MKPSPGLRSGVCYFYVHFITEVVCFYTLGHLLSDTASTWIIPLTFDMLAFVPQSLIGALSDRKKQLPLGVIGVSLMAITAGLLGVVQNPYILLLPLCLGNACTHVAGAQATLRCAEGKLAPSAIFVAGGSFGVITGRLLSVSAVPPLAIVLFAFTAMPFVFTARADRMRTDAQSDVPCAAFRCSDPDRSAVWVIVLAVFVVIVRGYMGYGIPTSWIKTTAQTVLLYVTMGLGKALGGILADRFGVRRTALFSAAAAVPFLLCGDRVMLVSLVGVMLFSMTMSVTLGLLVSVLPASPGLAFGLTTIGLFIGTVPTFFVRFTTLQANCIIIAVLSAVCLAAMHAILRRDRSRV